MSKILNWLKTLGNSNEHYVKPQKFVALKRQASAVNFIHAGHPLYDNIVENEKNQLRILAPNETAYNETSLIHNFVAIVTYNEQKYLLINSFKHFKEQSIGGLLQFDENIYTVIPFFEDEEEYQTATECVFKETYEYDHPIETYAILVEENQHITKITLERGKKPITVNMIDSNRKVFTPKLTQNQIEYIDYVVMPALIAYNDIQEKRKNKAS